jgi:transcriptional regulator with XRE-family HTH domain
MAKKIRKKFHRPERDRTIHQVLQAIRDMKPSEVASKCFVSASTVANWRRPVSAGGTRYPQHATLAAVAKTVGLEFRLVSADDDRQDRSARNNGHREIRPS